MFVFHYGKWDSWGLEVSYSHYDRVLCFSFIHWWVGLEWVRK